MTRETRLVLALVVGLALGGSAVFAMAAPAADRLAPAEPVAVGPVQPGQKNVVVVDLSEIPARRPVQSVGRPHLADGSTLCEYQRPDGRYDWRKCGRGD